MGRAEESYSGPRAAYSQLAWDQVLDGVYLTESSVEKIQDPVTGETKQKRIVHIRLDPSGEPIRRYRQVNAVEVNRRRTRRGRVQSGARDLLLGGGMPRCSADREPSLLGEADDDPTLGVTLGSLGVRRRLDG